MAKRAQEPDHEHLLDAVALFVVDVQERLLPAMVEPDAFIDRVAFSIEAARVFGLKVIFTEQVPDKLGRTPPRLRKLAPKARVFGKSSFSAFQAKGMQDYLRDLNIYHLLICGLEIGVCIYQTAIQASELDLDVTLLSDCLTSRRPEDDAFVLPSLARNGCHVLPSETVFYSLLADAKNPRFRAYSELVKKYHAIRQGDQPPLSKAKDASHAGGKTKTEIREENHPPPFRETGRKKKPKRDRSPKRSQPPREKPAAVEAATAEKPRGAGKKGSSKEAIRDKSKPRRKATRTRKKSDKQRIDRKPDSA